MQSVNELILSDEEVVDMLRTTLVSKGLLGTVNIPDIKLISVMRGSEGEGGWVIRTSMTPRQTPLMPSGPMVRGDTILCQQNAVERS